MTNVLIQPCASPVARRNWRKTVDQPISFTSDRYAAGLTASELEWLTELHSSGRAMFWGRTSFHDKSMLSVRTGDVVLFTWSNHIRAIGTVGASFRNPEFGDLLWHESGDEERFPNVFSLLDVVDAELPYSVLWNVPGIKAGDTFRQGRVLTTPRVTDAILEAIGARTAEAENAEEEMREAVDEGLRNNVTLQPESRACKPPTATNRSSSRPKGPAPVGGCARPSPNSCTTRRQTNAIWIG